MKNYADFYAKITDPIRKKSTRCPQFETYQQTINSGHVSGLSATAYLPFSQTAKPTYPSYLYPRSVVYPCILDAKDD